ncbi:MAG: chemotaxis protein CheW [Terriglobales bacterium]
MATGQFCTFFLGGQLFGVPVPQVQEVIGPHDMTPVPLAPEAVSGVINLRGQIVVAIDLRRRLQLARRAEGELPMNVVVRSLEGTVSLQVDEIGDVIEAEPATFEPPPETLHGPVRAMTLGVHKLEGSLLHVLDTERACQVSATGETASAER